MLKKTLVVAVFVTAIAAPAFAQSAGYYQGMGNSSPNLYAPQSSLSGNDAYAQAAPTAKRSTNARSNDQENTGIFKNLPAGITDPYAYHNQLMQIN